MAPFLAVAHYRGMKRNLDAAWKMRIRPLSPVLTAVQRSTISLNLGKGTRHPAGSSSQRTEAV